MGAAGYWSDQAERGPGVRGTTSAGRTTSSPTARSGGTRWTPFPALHNPLGQIGSSCSGWYCSWSPRGWTCSWTWVPEIPTVGNVQVRAPGRRPGLLATGRGPAGPVRRTICGGRALPPQGRRGVVGEASTAEPRAWMVAVPPVGLVRSSYGACVMTFPVCVVPVCVVVDAAQVVRGIAARRRWDPAERP